MTIPQRILLHVALGAGLVIAVSTAVTYAIVYNAAKQTDLKHLDTYVTERSRREEIGFQQVEQNLQLVRGQFLKRLEASVPTDYETKWNERFALFPDGSWRSRTNFIDGRRYSTLWAHKQCRLTPELKQQVLCAQDLCDELLPSWMDSFPSTYFVLPGWLNIGFDPRIPNWVWDTPADYDPSALEWFQLAMPNNRFGGSGSHWTGIIEEPTTKVPIVSVYVSIERDGRFLGSIGHDLYCERLMKETTRSGLPGAMHFIFRGDGRLIAHPTKLKEILASKGQLKMQDSGEPALASLYRAISPRGERQFSGYDVASELYYSVARLAGPDWFFLTTMPRELLQRQAFQSAQWVLWSGLVSLTMVLAFLAATLRRQIALPLAELTRATKQMSGGDISARAVVDRKDEFGTLAGAFNEMAARVALRDAELHAEKASLERRVAERTAELRESEARFATAFRYSPAILSLIRAADGVIVEVNNTFLQKLERSREQVIGKTPFELNAWMEPEKLAEYRQQLESHGHILGQEAKIRTGSGTILTVLASSYRVEIGGVLHYLNAGVDISLRKEAEAKLQESERRLRESEARFSTAFHTNPVLMTIARLDDARFVEINEAFIRLTGWQRAELIGHNSSELGLWVDAKARGEFFEQLRRTGEALNAECEIRTRHGKIHTMQIAGKIIEINREPHLITFGLDVTEQKQAEAELQNALVKERELGQLKSDFVSLVSHEFRTPLEVIMSSTDNLQRYHERLAKEKRDQLLQTIHKSVRRMAGMMEEVLVLGRVESGKMDFKPEPFELPAFCHRIAEEIQSATNRRCPIEVQADGVPQFARGDEDVLRHIMSNLLSNAVKYSAEDQAVTFAVSKNNGDATFQIIDQGCGIPESDQKRLFQAFHRGSNVEQIPGTGLGLLIVQRCVELHGGEISFTSIEGQGTTFTVKLPLFSETIKSGPKL